MEIPTRKTSKRTIEPVDEWLQNEGYYRKHVPKDPTSLFRAVSEQVYKNQRCHIRVRKECVEFMRENRKMFEEKISIPYDSYLDQMSCFTEWGGMNEILAMSQLYKRNVVIFHGQKLTRETVIDHGYKDGLYLCFTPPKQYETVFTQEHTTNAGFCQSLVYQTLYKNVFDMNNVDITVHKMLHERNSHLRHEKFFLEGNLDIRNQLTVELLDKIKENEDTEELQLLSRGITPFPYRVAKALDPNIYRNVDYDIWHEIKKEVRNSGYTKFNSTELQAGAKCLVHLELKENDKINNNFLPAREEWANATSPTKPKRLEPFGYTGHIQEMSKNQGPVLVFIEELGQMVTVPYEALKPFPQRKTKQNNWAMATNKRNMVAQSPKSKKPWNSNGRRPREQGSNENNTNKNQINNAKGLAKNINNKPEWNPEAIIEKQVESYMTYKEYSTDAPVDNMKAALENTHITPVETIEEIVIEKKNKNPGLNTEAQDNGQKIQNVTNLNNLNQSNKQPNQRPEKNEIFYPAYPNTAYPQSPRFSEDHEIVNYELVKNWDVDGNGVPYSGVKYFWSQNMWPNGITEQQFGDNTFFIAQPPPPDANFNPAMMNGPNVNGEIMNQGNNNNLRYNNRSPPRPRDKENHNGAKSNGQKSNYRSSEFRNMSASRDLQQSPHTDLNRNRIDSKNTNFKEQQQQHQIYNNKEAPRGNKSNGMAPRFKRSYEGRNRNDHHNGQNQYRPHLQQHHHQQQQHQDCDYRGNKKQQQPQQVESQMIGNQCEINDVNHMQQQPQQNSLQPQQQNHQQPQQQQQLQPPVVQRQTPPPINNGYPYSVPYNQQVPYIPLSTYPVDSEPFAGHYYPAPGSFVQVPYMPPPADLSPEVGSPGCMPVYPAMDGFPAQYPMYSQYAYPQPSPPMFPAQPPPPIPAPPADTTCYTPYPGQSYFIPYPPPPPPMAMTCSPNPTNTPAH
ncbi:uncharacterized protein LOC100118517 isoform X2 [Nasonia vitripennis]|uniref:OTU domain-containing protein n=1 Tax=Nasonia vitripennis TaxID=7425 RepID=A0A7M7QI12_NASVI|nr:uncharacterized protein LOC100118517 isoform X2 [Nasonia vitripennis]